MAIAASRFAPALSLLASPTATAQSMAFRFFPADPGVTTWASPART
jgi:hypothetical protein